MNRATTTAIAVSALIMTLFAFTPGATAEVVYTPVNVTFGRGSVKLNLNHDGISDFILYSAWQITVCGNRGGLIGSTTITPRASNGVVVSDLNFAAVLGSGISIDASSTFYERKAVVTQFLICSYGNQHIAGYLGLEFQVDGQTHYGWAQVIIDAFFYNYQRNSMTTTLVDFAYETIPGQAIKTGQTSDNIDDARSIPESIHPVDFGYGSPVAPVSDNPLTESLERRLKKPSVTTF